VPDRIAIVQSNYIPWKGYFDLIAGVDAFVLLDEVQYTRRDWRNRNRIKAPDGLRWLSIPVEVSGRYTQRIDETQIADPGWARSHLSAIEQAYAAAPYLDELRPLLRAAYAAAESETRLSAVNRRFLDLIAAQLHIETPILWSTDIERPETVDGDARNDRLISICTALGATEYVSGPAARGYLDDEAFAAAGVRVRWARYEDYREYPQPHPPFEHGVSALDLLLCTGPDAARYLRPQEVVDG
jgi:hypothetical protein